MIWTDSSAKEQSKTGMTLIARIDTNLNLLEYGSNSRKFV